MPPLIIWHNYLQYYQYCSLAHLSTADTCLTHEALPIFSPHELSCLCVCADEESTVGKVWIRRLEGLRM